MEEFIVNDNCYRIKKMSAIELLALKTQIDFESYEQAEKSYNTMLTKIEVKIKDQWFQVKDGNNYYPADIENDFEVISTLISKMISYIKEVFFKSNALNEKTE